MSSREHSNRRDSRGNQSFRFHAARHRGLHYRSRISSIDECTRVLHSGSTIPHACRHAQREAVERSRVESCNSSPRHGGGEGVGGQRGGTDAGGGPDGGVRRCGDGG